MVGNCTGLELALRHSSVGEKLRVRCTNKFGFGAQELVHPPVPAYSDLEFAVEVLEVKIDDDLLWLHFTDRGLFPSIVICVLYFKLWRLLMMTLCCSTPMRLIVDQRVSDVTSRPEKKLETGVQDAHLNISTFCFHHDNMMVW